MIKPKKEVENYWFHSIYWKDKETEKNEHENNQRKTNDYKPLIIIHWLNTGDSD